MAQKLKKCKRGFKTAFLSHLNAGEKFNLTKDGVTCVFISKEPMGERLDGSRMWLYSWKNPVSPRVQNSFKGDTLVYIQGASMVLA